MSAGDERRVCLFTGAAGTLGTYFCQRLASRYDIAAAYRRRPLGVPSQHQRALDPLEPEREPDENRHPVFAIQGDLGTEADCERIVDAALSRYGRIDLLVNAAVAALWGPMLGNDRLLRSATAQFETAVTAPLRLATVVARRYWQSRDEENRRANRNIVNLSSVAGMRLYPASGQSVYAASKAALNQLTAHMALEFAATGVRVNAVAPNSFPSLVSLERVTQAITNLDESSLTSALVVVDGERDEVIEMRPFGAETAVSSGA